MTNGVDLVAAVGGHQVDCSGGVLSWSGGMAGPVTRNAGAAIALSAVKPWVLRG